MRLFSIFKLEIRFPTFIDRLVSPVLTDQILISPSSAPPDTNVSASNQSKPKTSDECSEYVLINGQSAADETFHILMVSEHVAT